MGLAHWLYKAPLRLRTLFRRSSVERELEEEIQFHLDQQVEAQMARGVPAEEARAAARRELGNATLVKEEAREAWGWRYWTIFAQEMRHSWRRLAQSPGFAITAVLTLALGIGASTAMFTLVDSVILKPLSYRESGRLVALWERIPFAPEPIGPNPRHAGLWAKNGLSYEGIALVQQGTAGLTLAGVDHPVLAGTVTASTNLFELLRVTPLVGRTFGPEHGVQGGPQVAILTYGLWQSAFGGDPGVVGKLIHLGDTPAEVIGVLPAGFHFPNRNALRPFLSKQALANVAEPAIFRPLQLNLSGFSWNGEYGNMVALARLKPGVTIGQAQTELDSLEREVEAQIPAAQRFPQAGLLKGQVQAMQEAVVGKSGSALWLLMAAVLGLLLIACVNLANMQLARALARQPEAGLRTALGAPAWRLIWGTLSENLILAVAGGAAGMAVAYAGLDLFRRSAMVDLPRLPEVQLNTTVLLYSAAVTMGASLLFGVLPGLKLLHAAPLDAVQQSSRRSAGSRESRRLHRWLIGLQVCGSTTLLLITGLFARNLAGLLWQDKGFETANVAFAQVNLGAAYGKTESRVAFIDQVLERLRAMPGAQAAGYVSVMPLEGESWVDRLARPDRPGQQGTLVNLRWASPGYFEAMGHRLVAGRLLEERDRGSNNLVISEGVARALWPGGENPIGGIVGELQGRKWTVVGVIGDSRSTSLKTPPTKLVWLHHANRPGGTLYFLVRGARPGAELAAAIRQSIWSLAPGVTIARAKTLDAQVNESLAAERFQTFLLAAFAAAALLLAMLGIYGVLSYAVAARRREFGIRLALGATRGRIYSIASREVAAPVLGGLAAGFAGYLCGGRLVAAVVEGARRVDLPVMLLAGLLFLISALFAGFFPARRAASVDPLESLRTE